VLSSVAWANRNGVSAKWRVRRFCCEKNPLCR
jgi:hypothetical protein